MFRYSVLGRAAAALALILTLGAASANAASITFDLSGSSSDGSIGNQRVYTDVGTGLTMYVTAFFHDNHDFDPAAVGRWSSGLGGCNPDEDGSSFPCSSPEHALDNDDELDFLLFTFSAAVDLTSIDVVEISGNTDASYWVGNISGLASQLNYLTNYDFGDLAARGFGSRQDNNGDGSRTVTLNSPTNSYTALLFGASTLSKSSGTVNCSMKSERRRVNGNWIWVQVQDCDGGKDDYFKIDGITVDYSPQVPLNNTPVPEPGTIALFGLGLAGVAAAVRRRRRA